MTPPGHLHIVDPSGHTVLHEDRPASPPATMTSNGILLLPHEGLLGFTSDGERFPIWTPPAPLRTAPILVGGAIYVATADDLYTLM